MSAQERYHRDPVFHTLVDTLFVHIREAMYTPTELREACHLAAVMYENYHVRNIRIQNTANDAILPPHLRERAPFLECSKCKRKSWSISEIQQVCSMTQPDGTKCDGFMLTGF